MQRTVLQIPISDTKVRVRVRIEGENCEPETPQFNYNQRYLLTQLADNPMLLMCGLTPFETLKVYYNGSCWVADAEAVVQKA